MGNTFFVAPICGNLPLDTVTAISLALVSTGSELLLISEDLEVSDV